ncbi:MAG: IPT/TIG domain-containing protein [Gemmatimonadota bacterium]
MKRIPEERGSAVVPLLLLLLLYPGCGGEPTRPPLPDLEVRAAEGDGAFGVPGDTKSLSAVVVRRDNGKPQADVRVEWAVASGDAQLLPGADGASDDEGVVAAEVRFGEVRGPVTVRVSVVEQPSASATFNLTVVDRPDLVSLSPTAAGAGGTVVVRGRGFLADGAQDVVLFSGIRGEVLSAASDSLVVRVPPCLPVRQVEVTVQLGELVSNALSLAVDSAGAIAPFPAESWVDLDDPAAPGCLLLPGAFHSRYLMVAASASTVGAGRWGSTVRGLWKSVGTPAPGRIGPPRRGLEAAAPPPPPVQGREARSWEAYVRAWEREALGGAASPGGTAVRPAAPGRALRTGPPEGAPRPVPQVGEERTFNVLNAEKKFDRVTAVARYVGSHAAVYVDKTAPAGGFDDDDLAAFAQGFDSIIHPTVTEEFGGESDLDGNGRVVILFTPTVNRLTPCGSEGFVGGFFFGLDLLPDREGSNKGEIFYALVPDPEGSFSDPRPKDQVLNLTPGVLAHEFQHMVHFNQRVLIGGAETTEALWLSEGMAQMAEYLVGEVYAASRDSARADLFEAGNRGRARRYLQGTDTVSLIVVTGQGSLAERGAGWLFTLYLWDRFRDGILGRLTRSTLSGVDNVTTQAGTAWDDLLLDWWSALYVEGLGSRVADSFSFSYPRVDLGTFLSTPTVSYPLRPPVLGGADFSLSRTLWSSSAALFAFAPGEGAAAIVRFAGEAGGAPPPESALRLRLLRIF